MVFERCINGTAIENSITLSMLLSRNKNYPSINQSL